MNDPLSGPRPNIAAQRLRAGAKEKLAAAAMRFSTAADPSAVVASSAAAEKLAGKRQREYRAGLEKEALERDAAAAADGAPAPRREPAPLPETLAALPPPLGRFMASQGFTGPTAIQSKWVLCLIGCMNSYRLYRT